MVKQNSQNSNTDQNGLSKVFLRRVDQIALALVLLVCFIIFGINISVQVWQRGQLIDIDHVDLQDAGYQVNYRVNINEAGWPEIANLPGFGEVTARTVVDYRDQNGRFS